MSKPAKTETKPAPQPQPPAEDIYQLVQIHPAYFLIALVLFLATALYLITKFKITWKKFIPTFHSRSELKHQEELAKLKAEVTSFEEKLKAYRKFDFFEKTDNGEHVGYAVAKKPYVELWADGNWNSQEYHTQLKTFEKLWDEEDEIIIYGERPNLPSDIYAIIESKAKYLPKLTIYCTFHPSKALKNFLGDYEHVKIVVRG